MCTTTWEENNRTLLYSVAAGAATLLFCKLLCLEDGCWLLGHVWLGKELLQGACLKPRHGCVVAAGRVIISEDLVGWTDFHVSSGLLECHSCRIYLTDSNEVRFLIEFSIRALQSPQRSFIAVRILSLACGVQTAAFPKSYCLLKCLFTRWSNLYRRYSVGGRSLTFLRHALRPWFVERPE